MTVYEKLIQATEEAKAKEQQKKERIEESKEAEEEKKQRQAEKNAEKNALIQAKREYERELNRKADERKKEAIKTIETHLKTLLKELEPLEKEERQGVEEASKIHIPGMETYCFYTPLRKLYKGIEEMLNTTGCIEATISRLGEVAMVRTILKVQAEATGNSLKPLDVRPKKQKVIRF